MLSPWNKYLGFFCRPAAALMLAGSLVFPGNAMAEGLPFSPGEEIHYDVKWQMYKAGEAVVKVLPFEEKKGGPAWHFELSATTNRFLDTFFKVRDHIQGFVARDFSGSVGYGYSGRGKKKKEIQVTFFPKTSTAAYSNFEEKREPIKIPRGCFDPMSSYFKMRTFDLVEGQTLSFPITDGKKTFLQKGDILGKEKLKLKSGTYDTLVIEPYVNHFSGVFEESKDPTVRVWITDDERHIPVRIKVQVVVGSIYLDLRSYVPGQKFRAQKEK
ncbi:MAG: DUF3108 domain-containing protein [Desulfobacter sp.]|nr:MAG: DUF3108 domain-containing protein [Desulfobacter sp.]